MKNLHSCYPLIAVSSNSTHSGLSRIPSNQTFRSIQRERQSSCSGWRGCRLRGDRRGVAAGKAGCIQRPTAADFLHCLRESYSSLPAGGKRGKSAGYWYILHTQNSHSPQNRPLLKISVWRASRVFPSRSRNWRKASTLWRSLSWTPRTTRWLRSQ
jgi:hypothetical protein